MAYISLHNHTHFSIAKALPSPEDLLQKAKDLGQSAIAITDNGALIAGWDGLKYSKKIGIKLIIGCEFYFCDDVTIPQRLRHLILIAKNHVGYKNLLLLSKLGNDNLLIGARRNYPRIDWKMIETNHEGLICLTGGTSGILGQLISTRRIDEAKEQAKRLKSIFGEDLGLEIQPNNLIRLENNYSDYMDQRLTNNQVIKFGKELDIKIVPTTNTHFLNKEDHETHDVFMAIGAGQSVKSNNRPKYTDDFYYKSEEEVRTYFARLFPNEVDGWLANTIYFADKCEEPDWIHPKYSNPSGKELPEFPVKDQKDYDEYKIWLSNQTEEIQNKAEDASYLRYCCEKAFPNKHDKNKIDIYRARLEEELDVLETCGLSSYMLIVSDYVDWARNNNIPVNYGRGSVGGAYSAYLLGIHQADSILHDLIFARFHNKLKKSYSDIDCDFGQAGKPLVQEYIHKKYGADKVAGISNYLTLSPKQYVKAISRAFQFGGDIKTSVTIGQDLSDLIPIDTSGKSFNDVTECIEKLPILAEYCKKYPELLKYANLLQNKPTALAKHAGGLVISKRPLLDIVALRNDEEHGQLLEFEKERTEEGNLIKMDILGVSTLDIVQNTYGLLKSRNKQIPVIDFYKPDKKTYDLISSGNTNCIFQLGTSGGTIDLCKGIKPQNLEDLSIINTLARPHAKPIRKAFVEAREKKKKIKYLHPKLERAFKDTLGFPLYEESLLILVQDIAGWDLHKADVLRKMTKDKGKHPEKEKQIHEDLIADMQKNGFSLEMANKIWDQIIVNFSLYSFTHTHSIIYAMLAYETAYLKANYPIEFLTANLNFESNSNSPKAEDNIIAIKRELRAMGIKIIPPNINTSERFYKIIDDQTLMTGFEAIKFIGTDSIPEIIEKRPFNSFENFLSKIESKKVRASGIQALAACGALDEFKLKRKQMFLYASDFKKKVQLWQKKTNPGEFKYPWPEKIEEWTIAEKFAMEKHYIGEGLSGTYFQIYPNFFNPKSINFKDLSMHYDADMSKNERFIDSSLGMLQGVIVDMREFLIKKEDSKLKGQQMMHLSIQDPYENLVKGTMFPDTLKQTKEKLRAIYGNKIKLEIGTAILFNGTVDFYQGEFGIIIDCVKNCVASPSKPEELKAQKVAMRIPRKKKDKIATEPEEILEEMEEEMIEEGLNEND